jgi:hypothetical protein
MNTYSPYAQRNPVSKPLSDSNNGSLPLKSGNPPEKKIRSGAISATIWKNEQDTPTGKIAYKTVSFERTYKDKNGQWQTTNKLRGTDIPRAVLVLNKAYEHLSLGEEIEGEAY